MPVQLAHKERWQQGQPESHGRTLWADNEPGGAWAWQPLRWTFVRPVGKTSHARPGSWARLACPIRLGDKKIAWPSLGDCWTQIIFCNHTQPLFHLETEEAVLEEGSLRSLQVTSFCD